MFILPESIKDTDLEAELDRICEELKKAGGTIESKTRLGKRAFARRMHKQEAGHYVIITFSMEQEKIQPLLARFKLNESVFRVQIVRAVKKEPAAAGSAKE
jgi:ribosomal protein S6